MVVNNPGGTGWFHMHHSTGSEPLRLMVYGGTPLGVGAQINRPGDKEISGNIAMEEGGRSITYVLEDPYVKVEYKRMLEAEGVTFDMPDWVYTGEAPNGEVLDVAGP